MSVLRLCCSSPLSFPTHCPFLLSAFFCPPICASFTISLHQSFPYPILPLAHLLTSYSSGSSLLAAMGHRALTIWGHTHKATPASSTTHHHRQACWSRPSGAYYCCYLSRLPQRQKPRSWFFRLVGNQSKPRLCSSSYSRVPPSWRRRGTG